MVVWASARDQRQREVSARGWIWGYALLIQCGNVCRRRAEKVVGEALAGRRDEAFPGVKSVPVERWRP